jgi:ACS family D-galactonate transporter-like MFS transporter
VTQGRRSWTIVALLFLFMMLNFGDKAIVGLAGVPIMQDMGLTPSQFGLVGSSFFFLFSISAVIGGFIANRVETRWVLLVMATVWAVTQLPMIAPVNFATMLACRIALGAGEGPAYPVALHSIYKWFPNEKRTLPTAIVSQGAGFGLLLAIPVLNWIIVRYSWHWAFGGLGIAGLLWALAWLFIGREGTVEQQMRRPGLAAAPIAAADHDFIPYARLLLNGTVLATYCTFFGAYWALSIGLAWQTPFLVQGLGYSQSAAGLIAALPWGISVIVSVGAGWYSQRLLARGVTSRVARGIFAGACVAVGGLAFTLLDEVPTAELKIAVLIVGGTLPSVIYVISHAVVSEFVPVRQRGAILAIGNAFGTAAGLLAPFVMGGIVESAATPAQGYFTGFFVCGLIMVAGGLIGILFIRPEREALRLTARQELIAAAAKA